MAINKTLWLNSSFTKTVCPQWKCPTCHTGTLTIKPQDVYSSESKSSKAIHDDPDFEFYWISYRFSAHLICDNTKCEDIVIVSGRGGVEEGYVETSEVWYSEYYDSFSPEYFVPNINIFQIELSCPQPIRDEIEKSFSLFFSDTHSCANKIRIAIEILMNEFKIPSSKTVNSKKRIIPLHERIMKFGVKYPKITNALLAIKWIGNAGSHTSRIEKSDLIDAYEILEHSLHIIFNDKTKEIDKIIKEINKRKAPRSKNQKLGLPQPPPPRV